MTMDRLELAKKIYAAVGAGDDDPWDRATARSLELGLSDGAGGPYFNTNQLNALKAADAAIAFFVAWSVADDLMPAELRYLVRLCGGRQTEGGTRTLKEGDLTGEGVLALCAKLESRLQ